MKRLGDSVDWSREFFTMDERISRAVREAFVRLYEEGLIYRGKYIVNWCPRCMTAVSDLEVVHDETQGKLWEIRYPVVGSPGESIVVATTRPETMLGDTAVAVNPPTSATASARQEGEAAAGGPRDPDHRRRHSGPARVRHRRRQGHARARSQRLRGRHAPRPAEDRVINETAHMNANAGPYEGLDRYEARERVVADLEAGGVLVSVKDYLVPLGKCDRCKTVVEPRISTQWFVNKQAAGRPAASRRVW